MLRRLVSIPVAPLGPQLGNLCPNKKVVQIGASQGTYRHYNLALFNALFWREGRAGESRPIDGRAGYGRPRVIVRRSGRAELGMVGLQCDGRAGPVYTVGPARVGL